MKKRVKINKRANKKASSNKSSKDYRSFLIPLRYLILLGLMFTLPLIYSILTPITVYSASTLLKLVYTDVFIYNESISINSNVVIQIIPACVAGSAYLLLLILNLSVSMNLRKRAYSIIFSFIILFIFNILRIFLLAILFENNFYLFDLAHKIFWYFLSTLFVVLIWFFIVKSFSIKEIPVYSDIISLIKKTK